MERQTDLTLDEMMKELRTNTQGGGHNCHGGGSGLPACLLVNEVGVMAHSGNLAAEAFLCEILLCHSPDLQAISYSYLESLPRKQAGTVEAVKVFMADPKNAEVVQMVFERQAKAMEELGEELRRSAKEKMPGNS